MIRLLQRSLICVSARDLLPLLSGIVLLLVAFGCSKEEASYFPLDEGRWWEYQETLIIRDKTFSQRLIIRNLPAVEQDQTTYYVQEVQGHQLHYYSLAQEGIVRHAFDSELVQINSKKQLQIPLKVDGSRSWEQESRLGVIESRTFAAVDRILTRPKVIMLTYTVIGNEDVVVPAGRFTQCLKIKGVGSTTVKVDRGNVSAEVQVENTDWYAPGIGLVKTERIEKSESSFLKKGFYNLELL